MSSDDKKPGDNSGGVRHDSRGNAVWQWAVDSGKQALDSTSRLLKRLDVPGLKLEGDTAENKAPRDSVKGKAGMGAKADRQTGYNPYGAAVGTARAAPSVARPSASTTRPGASRPTAVTKPAAETAKAPSLWQRLFRRR